MILEMKRLIRSHSTEKNDGGGDIVEVECDDGVENEDLNVGDEKNDDEKDSEKEDNNSQFQKKKRKKTSKAHVDFHEVIAEDGSQKWQCIHCKALLCKPQSSTTSLIFGII